MTKTIETALTAETLFDPVLFAATAPSRKPRAKDKTDAKERDDDAIEPNEHDLAKDVCVSVPGSSNMSARP